jgi:Tol biopolymer transport system component
MDYGSHSNYLCQGYDPVISPNGTAVAFTDASAPLEHQLWLKDIASGKLTRIGGPQKISSKASFSVDGSKLIVRRVLPDNVDNVDISIYNMNGLLVTHVLFPVKGVRP